MMAAAIKKATRRIISDASLFVAGERFRGGSRLGRPIRLTATIPERGPAVLPSELMNLQSILTAVVLCMISSFASGQSVRTLDSFQSGGKEIRVEKFGLNGNASAPSIIVLHGATGVEYANRFIATLAQGFAEKGFVVYLVHYFDRTGAVYADDDAIKRSSGDWLKTVDDAVTFVQRKRPHASIGMFGYSLGGYLAAAESVKNDQVAAAVILAGGLDEGSAAAARHSLPVLILHGDADTRVPIQESRRLETVLKRLGGEPEMHVYAGEGHIMKSATYIDVVRRGAEFFDLHLRSAKR